MRSESLTGDRGWFIERRTQMNPKYLAGKKVHVTLPHLGLFLTSLAGVQAIRHITQKRTVKHILI